MVGEFPSLQGVIGREYALLSGENPEVANAIKEHYMPICSGGKLPESLSGAMLSIADKVDTICGIIAIGLKPSGTSDPYGLRRMALGVIHILEEKSISLSLNALILETLQQLKNPFLEISEEVVNDIVAFFKRRFSYDLAAKGIEADVIEAATKVDFDDIKDCVLRAKALAAVRSRPEFGPLSTAFKRITNILKDFEGKSITPFLLETKEEKALYEAYLSAQKNVEPFLKSRDYEKALVTLLSLKPQIDNFFDHVLVMAEEPDIRANRLALLWNIANIFLKIGDLSVMVVS
jgi:glycyl-tRNA synthetase beta chain